MPIPESDPVPDPAPDPIPLVTGYLGAMEARDLETARGCLASGFVMQFPGRPPMHRLEELLDWARPRYRSLKKTFDGVDRMTTAQGRCAVYVRGTLAGEWTDGTRFDGIRFIDRFEIEDGRIVRQDVWNDMGEWMARR